MQDRYYSDEELTAFLDGEDSLAPVAEIAAALKKDEALQKRLAALEIDRELVTQSFAGFAPSTEAMPDLDMLDIDEPYGRRFGLAGLAVAAAISLAVGLGAGVLLSAADEPGWTDYVAAYQALYSNSTVANIDVDPAAQAIELERVASAIGKDVSLETLRSFPEAEYKRAQILSFEGRALAQLVFETSTGAPLALCIIRSDADVDRSIEAATMEGMRSAWWSQDGYEYLLIGGKDPGLVARIASSLSEARI